MTNYDSLTSPVRTQGALYSPVRPRLVSRNLDTPVLSRLPLPPGRRTSETDSSVVTLPIVPPPLRSRQ